MYSFGIDNNWKFTDAMRDDFKCETHAFDPNLYEEEEGERHCCLENCLKSLNLKNINLPAGGKEFAFSFRFFSTSRFLRIETFGRLESQFEFITLPAGRLSKKL